jgi:hypothetical protein
MMRGSYREREKKSAVIFLIIGAIFVLTYLIISYMDNSWWLIGIGSIFLLIGFSKLINVVFGTAGGIGTTITFSCPYCKKQIGTQYIPADGGYFTCPHCRATIAK